MNDKKLQKLMKDVDKTKKPKHWRSFINKNTVEHNLILKYGNRAFCTHCQKYFDKNVDVHSHQKETCKWCGNQYYVKNHNIKNFSFQKDVGFYRKVNNQIVLRIFELESKYDYKTRTFKHNWQEFARFIPNIGTIINNTVSFFLWNIKISHNIKIRKWHRYTGSRLLYNFAIYPFNKKQLFRNTPLAYAPIKEFQKKYSRYTDFEVLQLAIYPSFELLWKMGLHRLSLSAKHFNKKGSFTKRFGVPKSFLKFMVENDLDYEDYRILKLIQEPNLELILQYGYYSYDYLSFMSKQGFIKKPDILQKFYYNSSELRTICKYVPLKKFLQYDKGVKNIHLYADYLKMAEQLNYSIKSKKRLFPKQLKARHDELSKKIIIMEDIKTQFGVYLRYLDLSHYTYQNNKYIIFPATSVDDIKDEGKQQGNCVATYLNPYLKKETEIYFIRALKNPTKSLITLEFKNGIVVQKELAQHRTNLSKEQLTFIDNWVKFREFADHKQNHKTKVIEYNFSKMVA